MKPRRGSPTRWSALDPTLVASGPERPRLRRRTPGTAAGLVIESPLVRLLRAVVVDGEVRLATDPRRIHPHDSPHEVEPRT